MDPRKRINARDALTHPYFSDLDSSNCVIPSFPLKCGFKALGLHTKPMDLMHKNKVAGYTFHYLENFMSIFELLKTQGFLMLIGYHRIIQLFCYAGYTCRLACRSRRCFQHEHTKCILGCSVCRSVHEKETGKAFVTPAGWGYMLAYCLKCEDVAYIGAEDLTVCADNVYSSVDVLLKEEEILNVLDFNLSSATVLDFVVLYLEYSRIKRTSR